ncbi:hypothetical protein DOY81_002114 [Sarcophaga bullata]|nr:hypothetical protein DOY81_002114 [Sarcophaga bullata]
MNCQILEYQLSKTTKSATNEKEKQIQRVRKTTKTMENNVSSNREPLQENDDQQYNKQINDKGNNNGENNGASAIIKKSYVLEEQQEDMDVKTSISINVSKNSACLQKLKDRTKSVGNKLSRKRQQLQQQGSEVDRNTAAVSELLVMMALGSKNARSREKSNTMCSAVQSLPNGVVPNKESKPNGRIKNEAADKKFQQRYSKKELQRVVEGLQELVTRLTVDDKKLRSKVERLAHNISGLQNFPLFINTSDLEPSTSAASKQRQNLTNGGDVKRRNSRHNSEADKVDRTPDKRKKNKGETLTPAEVFVKYINAILTEYLGDQQTEKLEKYKCLPSHIEDLETYASTLVEAGFGVIVESDIRVNRKNNRQAFISMTSDRESTERDGMVLFPVARQYAFDGDIVRAFVLNAGSSVNTSKTEDSLSLMRKPRTLSSHIAGGNLDNSLSLAEDDELLDDIDNEILVESEFEDPTDLLETSVAVITDNCPKAFVIKIVKQTELREVVGSISFATATQINSKSYYKLKPHDMRVPMVYIPKESCKDHVESANKEDICGMLYVARVLETDTNGHCVGELVQPVGKVGNLQDEIKAILLHNGLKDIKPYEQKFYEMYEGPMPPPTEEDLKNREDLRKKCIFTIDPLTARDLDDAVSVEKLNDNEYEIGVHISDVSHFLEENSELDELVKYRATSIYLVNEVIHMLPPPLCFRCSLLPGEDKYAFSVFWKWHADKEEFSTPRFTRSIINSCSQFAYEHAQKIIDNPTEDFDRTDFPEIYNEWTPSDIKWRVLLLHEIAQKLKTQRYQNGALSINNPKLRFKLDPVTGEPLTYESEGREEANFLIEEFMLLANQSVAKFIHDHFPDTSILRNHAPPLQKSLKALKERLNNLGMEFNITSSKAIYESMQRLCSEASDPIAVEACLSTLLTKPMARAKYYCSEGKTSDADFWHYALSIPIYTHFTSPIRRYPDILVHRFVAYAYAQAATDFDILFQD